MAKILIIEDEESIRENLLELLEAEEYEATGAENGLVGVQMAKSILPDLVICDLMMPEMDGYSVLKELRQDSVTAAIPLIFMTARADQNDKQRAMELGADDYLIKPCKSGVILKAIATHLSKGESMRNEARN